MLDPWIIEEILRRQRDKARVDRPVIEAPVLPPPPSEERDHEVKKDDADDAPERGVVVIDL